MSEINQLVEECNSVDEVLARLNLSPDEDPAAVRNFRDTVAVALDRKFRKGKTREEVRAEQEAEDEKSDRIHAILAAAEKTTTKKEAKAAFDEIKALLCLADDAAVIGVLGDRAAIAKGRAMEMNWALAAMREISDRLVYCGHRKVGFVDFDGGTGVLAFVEVSGSDRKLVGRFPDREAAKRAILEAAA